MINFKPTQRERLPEYSRMIDIAMAAVGVFSLGVVFGLLLAWRG